MIIEGCILVVLSILALILTLTVQNLGFPKGTEIVDGMITSSDLEKKEVTIEYVINNKVYSSTYNCEVYANVGEMPPIGLRVQVSVNPEYPDQIIFMHLMREMGRGSSGTHKYIDNKGSNNRFTISVFILILFLSGVYLILHDLKII